MINTIKQWNFQSAAFWSSAAGAAAVIMGILNIDKAMIQSVQNVLIAVGGVLIAIPVHHVVAAQQTTTPPTDLPSPPTVNA